MDDQTVVEKETVQTVCGQARVGRRKESVARVRLISGSGDQITINGRSLENYFSRVVHQIIVRQPMKLVKTAENCSVVATVTGGGHTGQAGAIRMGIARALVELDPTARKILRQAGFLTRDPRAKERKKYGRRGARRGAQYSKR